MSCQEDIDESSKTNKREDSSGGQCLFAFKTPGGIPFSTPSCGPVLRSLDLDGGRKYPGLCPSLSTIGGQFIETRMIPR